MKREPDHIIRNETGIYLKRWWLIPRNKHFNVYLHQFLQSDDDRALHDHPWTFNTSILIKGTYLEHRKNKKTTKRKRFIPYIRIGKAPHRIELIKNKPVWTLFITGKRIREWGFYCPQGWKHWKKFTKPVPGGNEIGPGCDDT